MAPAQFVVELTDAELKEHVARGDKLTVGYVFVDQADQQKYIGDVAILTVQTQELATEMKFSFDGGFYIAATKQSFEPGKLVERDVMDILPIGPGQEYAIKSWTEEPIVTKNPIVPEVNFGLATGQAVTASAVAYRDMSFQDAPLKRCPVYFSATATKPESIFLIQPAGFFTLWFQTEAIQSGMMIKPRRYDESGASIPQLYTSGKDASPVKDCGWAGV